MITITLHGELGPIEAIQLRDDLAHAAAQPDRHIALDLAAVETVHPAIIAAIVDGAARVRRQAGTFCLVEPTSAEALRTLSLVSISTLIR